mmetsp:Transcript_26023/g.51045  ORF Transcript_26023/g.51045 Transcript_26023/m.51045 type:complete len:123 (+) Transcript_26023:458-826(+)
MMARRMKIVTRTPRATGRKEVGCIYFSSPLFLSSPLLSFSSSSPGRHSPWPRVLFFFMSSYSSPSLLFLLPSFPACICYFSCVDFSCQPPYLPSFLSSNFSYHLVCAWVGHAERAQGDLDGR